MKERDIIFVHDENEQLIAKIDGDEFGVSLKTQGGRLAAEAFALWLVSNTPNNIDTADKLLERLEQHGE